jgi:glycosyltransferase involved in cell wall biosynthesis
MTASAAAAGLPVLTFVVPCYNEEEVLGETSRRLLALLDELKGSVAAASSIVFVDDGSQDATWSLIEEFRTGDARVHGIKLARNFGHQHALLAGLMTAPGDIIISLDADLQDDLTVIPRMIEEHAKGAQIVYGVRYQRETDTWFKRTSARLYYRILRYFGVKIVPDHADFRLMSRRALETLRDFHEVNLFLRGIVPLLGFKTAIVKYQRLERFAGVTKYPFSRMLALAIDGITSFSAVPLQWITRIGFILALLSVLFGFWALVVGIYSPNRVTGWASIVTPIFFLGGLQLLATGVIGNYIAKIYLETKQRPRFIIETSI